MMTLEQYFNEAKIGIKTSPNVPQIDKNWDEIYPKNTVVEVNEGGETNFVIHARDGEYQIRIKTDTLIRIIKRKNQIEEDENFVQCGDYGEKSDFVEITEEDLYGK